MQTLFLQQTLPQRLQTLVLANRHVRHVTTLGVFAMHFMREWRREVRQQACEDKSESYYRLRLCFEWEQFGYVLRTIDDASPAVWQWLQRCWDAIWARLASEWSVQHEADVAALQSNPAWEAQWERSVCLSFLNDMVAQHGVANTTKALERLKDAQPAESQ